MAGRSTSTTSAELQSALASFVGGELGTSVTVDGLKRLPGGASREIYLFTLTRAGAARAPARSAGPRDRVEPEARVRSAPRGRGRGRTGAARPMVRGRRPGAR